MTGTNDTSVIMEQENAAQIATNVALTLLTETGEELSPAPIVLPSNTTVNQLQFLCNKLLDSNEDPVPITFRTEDGVEIRESLLASIPTDKLSGEGVKYLKCFFNILKF